MRSMDWAEASRFLQAGTRTAKVATVTAQGRPHVAPVWFTVDGRELVFSTSSRSVKARNLNHDLESRRRSTTRRHRSRSWASPGTPS
jgi:nitroimidazol reductase NimA-like FMN-containing flavoprotein (pyridoxamine 5'-phosphate oxidase superfamily)